MHPDLLRALERERRAELLRHHQFRQPPRDQQFETGRRTGQLHWRIRRALGVAFVGMGTRLLGERRPGLDLVDTQA